MDMDDAPHLVRMIKRRAAARGAAREAADAAFCRTPTADAILSTIDRALEMRCIGTVVGAAGTGKTSTLRWYASTAEGARYCVMNQAKASLGAVLAQVCEALSGSVGNGRPYDLYDIICNAIGLNRIRVLMVDEAQNVNDRNLDVLRSIHDDTGVALIFAGNDTLRSRFGNTQAAGFAQVTSRIGARVELDMPTVADVAALARHAGVHHPHAIAFLEELVDNRSGLRAIARLLKVTREHEGGDGDLGLSHLKMAANAMRIGKE